MDFIRQLIFYINYKVLRLLNYKKHSWTQLRNLKQYFKALRRIFVIFFFGYRRLIYNQINRKLRILKIKQFNYLSLKRLLNLASIRSQILLHLYGLMWFPQFHLLVNILKACFFLEFYDFASLKIHYRFSKSLKFKVNFLLPSFGPISPALTPSKSFIVFGSLKGTIKVCTPIFLPFTNVFAWTTPWVE